MQIETGKQKKKIKAVVYGPEGVGKSTLAMGWPKPIFIDIEGGTHQLDVARVNGLTSWAALIQTIGEFANGKVTGYQTLVVDTADWAEKMLKDEICVEARVPAMGDIPYGQLYAKLGAKWGQILDVLSRAGNLMHVVILAHSQLTRCEIPEEAGTFDKYELKLNNSFKVSTSAMTKEWADMVLFLNYEVLLIAEEGNKVKAQGGRRVCYTSHHACWDAKNRYGLPERLKLRDDGKLPIELAAVIADMNNPVHVTVAPPPPVVVIPPAAVTPEEVATPAIPHTEKTETPHTPEKQRLIDQLRELMTISGVTVAELDAVMTKRGIVPAGTRPSMYNEATLSRVIVGWDAVMKNIGNNRGDAK